MLSFRATVADISVIIEFSPISQTIQTVTSREKNPARTILSIRTRDLFYLFKSDGIEIFLKNKQN